MTVWTSMAVAVLAWLPVEGNGVARRELRPVEEFREISVTDGLSVSVTVDPEAAQRRLVVAGDENVVARVATEVRRGRLRVFALDPLDPSIPLRIEVTVPLLERIDAQSASSADVRGVSSDRLDADASGASRITLTGHAVRASIHAGGASHVSAAALDSEELVADVRGASSAELRASRLTDVAVQNASAVHLTGTPARVVRRLDAGSRLTVE